MRDPINSPRHYRFAGFEAIEIIEAVSRTIVEPKWAFLNGNVLKYVMRWPRKGGLRDLKKARWYLDRLIADMETPRVPPSPDYNPDDVAFRHGDVFGSSTLPGEPVTGIAQVIADHDGAGAYGNPVTPNLVDRKDTLRKLAQEAQAWGFYRNGMVGTKA